MYRSRQERLHLKQDARLHSARSWGNRSKLGVGYKDLTEKEYEKTRHKCTCTGCIASKQHKHLRKDLVDNSNEHDYFDYRDIDDMEQERTFFWQAEDFWEGSVQSWQESINPVTRKLHGVKTVTINLKTLGGVVYGC